MDNIKNIKEDCYSQAKEALEIAIQVLEEKPCENTVNRQAVLNTLDNMDKALNEDRTVENYKELLKECYEVLPSVTPQSIKDDENELKFYYVESIDDYWIGQRLGNFYYANWDEDLGFVWSKSRYLPWGKHIVNENSLWKEHTYPSEPVEIPFTKWIVGFMKKYSTECPLDKESD